VQDYLNTTPFVQFTKYVRMEYLRVL